MADGLFDNRYRYDYIYPRGRSGETLRALDTAHHDRPVVIKRPAPNDAPPIRAGQEVSILNERKALTRLAGHPVLAELLDGGQFFISGMPHQYIVMERAQGAIVADLVREYAARGERLPQLEMLVIVDLLLDLLQLAHTRDIVYNDVDAKHLFWDRETYRLKVIDWGNAVFLEGDEVTPQGISRQSDVFQVGELLYFMLSGGGRVDLPRDAGEEFGLHFGSDAERISPRLQAIVSKAVHPNSRLRYRAVSDLRRDLTDYRLPFEKERDSVVVRVNERLRRTLSKVELQGLLATLEPALALDPGYPHARQAREEIINQLRDLSIAADLDAARIYMEGGNWARAADLLKELRDKAGPRTAGLVNLLLDFSVLLVDSNVQPAPLAVQDAIAFVIEGSPAEGASVLLTEDTPDDSARRLQWLLAERISAHTPEVLLLRPNLYRLDLALAALNSDAGLNLGEMLATPRRLLADIQRSLDDLPGSASTSLADLRDGYRAVVDQITALNTLLAPVAAKHGLSNRRLPLNALDRANNAAMALADNMHVIGKQAASSPRDAQAALEASRAIDPTSGLWDHIERLLTGLYELLQSYQTYVPAADGSDLDAWLLGAHSDLLPFVERLFDEMLVGMVEGLKIAREAWSEYADAAVLGSRVGAITALAQATEAVGTVSPTLSGWLNQLRTVVDGAQYVERHAIFGGLGRALADGWEAFDRGRLADAERLGQQAREIARSDLELFAVRRLLGLSGSARDWIERSGIGNARRTQAALETVEALYTEEENAVRTGFASQMPSKDTYLRAMNKGLVELYARSSSAALRIFFFNTILLGALEAHDGRLDDARFWREVAVRALGGDRGPRHTATRALDEFIERRRDINAAAALLVGFSGSHALPTLESTRRQLEENPQAKALTGGIQALRELENALRDWSDGEFRSAGIKIENAMKAVSEVEQSADITLTVFRSWLMELQASAAELHNLSRQMRQAVERRLAEPVGVVREAHQRQVEVTVRLLGEGYAATLKQWHDTYEAFLSAYTDTSVRRSSRLNRFNELFRAMFIDRHPAYPLYRHWYDLTERSPEFPAPPTSEPTPRLAEGDIADEAFRGSRYADEAARPPARRLPLLAVLGAAAALILIFAVAAALISGGGGGVTVQVTATSAGSPQAGASPEATDETGSPIQSVAAGQGTPGPLTFSPEDLFTPTLVTRTAVPRPTDTPAPTHTPAPPTLTFTPAPPTDTPIPSETPVPTETYTPSPSPTPTLPPAGLQGQQDLLAMFTRLDQMPWSAEFFAPDTGSASWRLGVGAESPEQEIVIAVPSDTLDLYYGNNAPARIRGVDATLALTTYIPALLDSNNVYFGLMLQSAANPARAVGIYVQVAGPNTVNVLVRSGEELTFVRQFSVNSVIARVRLERNLAGGAISLFFNDFQIGQPIEFLPPDAPLQPALFVQHGGVIVSVTNWRVNLR